jgi:hypothetical protein
VVESRCHSCEEAYGGDGAIDCRVWQWQGEEYTEAPPPLIIDAILREVYAGPPPAAPVAALGAEVPDNLRQFFAAKANQRRNQVGPVANCCSPAEQASCCDAAEKASCCGDAAAGGCGCR